MKVGDTFSADLGRGRHLYVVMSNPTTAERLVVAAMISTYDEDWKNSTCILKQTDGHPSITHYSYVAYEEADLYSLERLSRLEQQNRLKRKPPFSAEVIERILRGADAQTSRLPDRCWLTLDDQGLIPE